MRLDAALRVAELPDEADPDQARDALVALRHAVLTAVAEDEDRRARAIAAAAALRDRDNLLGQRAAAVELLDTADARLRVLLGVLDQIAPDVARTHRAAWGIWPDPPAG